MCFLIIVVQIQLAIYHEKIDAETQESKNEINPLFQDNESLSTLLFLNAKIIESAGADMAILSDDSEIAGELLLHGIWGHGEAVTIEGELGQKMGKDLSQNAILREGIRQYGENLEVNQSVNIFASIDLQHSDENNNLPSLNGRLGYGRVKMGILLLEIQKELVFMNVIAGSVRFGKILFSPEILDSWTVAMFGPDNRINVYHRDGFEYPELQDHIPALKNKFIVLDRTVYSYKSTIDGFLRDEVFYAYGECGFYMIYAYPFKIRLYPGERCSEAEKFEKFYEQNEFQIVSPQEELTPEERRVYTELQKMPDKE